MQDLFFIGGGAERDRLYLNFGDGTFDDVTVQAGISARHRGLGSVVGDYDGEGWLDLFVTSHGAARSELPAPGDHLLYRNLGLTEGTGVPRFVEVAAAAGVATTSADWPSGTGAVFGDYDLDGDLDLFVAAWTRYVGGNVLFRNEGADATPRFIPVTEAAGLDLDAAQIFTPRLSDMDGDRCPELVLTGDYGTSAYYRNRCDGTFSTVAAHGTGLDDNGMGAAVADLDNDGRLDWYVTSVFSERPRIQTPGTGNYLYMNVDGHRYEDAHPSRASVLVDGGWGWGAAAVDLDHDGVLDLVETNGWRGANLDGVAEWLRERTYVYRNQGGFVFRKVGIEAGLLHDGQGRGLLRADFDNDGDQDLVIFNNRGRPALVRNELDVSSGTANWLRVFLDAAGQPGVAPDGIGSRVEATVDRRVLVRYLEAGSGYLGTHELSAHFGLGDASRVSNLLVRWANGQVTRLQDVAANQTLVRSP